MTVAWIGNRDTPVQHAVKHAAELLAASRCPVISIDADIHGTRAAVSLARRVGAAYDHLDDGALARETALLNAHGGMFAAAGEVRRRADLVVMVGELPPAARDFVSELVETAPDLAAHGTRSFFLVSNAPEPAFSPGRNEPVVRLACVGGDLPATLAAMRAQYAGRRVAEAVANFDSFADALGKARFAVFLCSGHKTDLLALEMLQGFVSDLNRKTRASVLFLPASETGWGSTLVSAWRTGFPMRTGFARGFPEFDPWRWDVARMLADGEADLHLWIAARPDEQPAPPEGASLIALTKTGRPIEGAVVTIPVGEPGEDHDAVIYSSRTGSFAARAARASSQLASVASVVNAIIEHLPAGAHDQC